MVNLVDVGVLRDTLIPNLRFHTALTIPVYLLGRVTNYAEAKDVLWASGQLANAWWTAVGTRVFYNGLSVDTALRTLSRPGKLVLAGVTLWGSRLLYRVVSRGIKRGHDDPRYDAMKSDPSGWNKAFFSSYMPEAVVQALITLPFTAPFRMIPVLTIRSDWKPYIEAAAIGLFTAGYALEALADYQLAVHQEEGKGGLLREGVWSIVRHPNYLGDALVHAAFPLVLLANDLFNPITLLGPITNYLFLRHFSGDKENEASQEARYAQGDPDKLIELRLFKREKNAFWPGPTELANKWVWIVAGVGAAGVAVERVMRQL